MKLSPEIYTTKIHESKRFYCDYLGFTPKFETEGFIILQHKLNPAYELLFCVPESPFVHEIFRPPFSGKGIIFQIEVDNILDEYKRLLKMNIPMIVDLIEEPINGKHFTILDPNGVYVDIVQFT